MSIRVKICGITTIEDALVAARLGCWALGFNFYSASPRYIVPEKAAEIIAALPASVLSIGLFVNADPAQIKEIRELCGLDLIQLSGDESLETCQAVGPGVIKAFRPTTLADLPAADDLRFLEAVLIDAPKGKDNLYGGTGRLACRELCQPLMAQGLKVILAGGITPENARKMADDVAPWALDLASGVESSPGIKDHDKMTRLFAVLNDAVSQADKKGM